MRRKVIFLVLYFSIMSFVYSNYKMKDNTIFFNDFAVYRKSHFGVMVPADIKSFKIINDRYAKDRYTVYFMGEEIRDSDLETFEEYSWFKTIKKVLANMNIELNRETLEREFSYDLAQKIINFPVSRSFNAMMELEQSEEEIV